MSDVKIYIGGDVSKGYCHFQAIDDNGSKIGSVNVFDDTAEGHNKLFKWLKEMESKNESVEFLAGLESSGGIENNFLETLRTAKYTFNIKVYHINPIIIRKFGEQKLHNNRSDASAALLIALYLRYGYGNLSESIKNDLAGELTLFRTISNMIERKADVQNELQSLLPRVHPELVQYCRGGVSNWVVQLLAKYPDANHLAKARVNSLFSIPSITTEKAKKLIEKAKTSVASQLDEATTEATILIVKQLEFFNEQIRRMKEKLIKALADHPAMKILSSIKGIGEWTAAALICEIQDIKRFPNAKSLVAYCGLDPQYDTSGDGVKKRGISKRGRSQIRRILFPGTNAAISHSKPIKSFYHRLMLKGKGHFVAATACMRKMLNIVYACWVSETKFDPNYEERLKAKIAKKVEAKKLEESKSDAKDSGAPDVSEKISARSIRIEAPVSRREARKRRQGNCHKGESDPLSRGLDPAS